MRDIFDAPLFLRLNRRNRGPSDTMRSGTLRRVVISDIVSHNSNSVTSSVFSGVPGNLIEDVKLTNCFFGHRGLPTVTDSHQKLMPDWRTIQVKEQEQGYPELGSFGPTPCQGFLSAT